MKYSELKHDSVSKVAETTNLLSDLTFSTVDLREKMKHVGNSQKLPIIAQVPSSQTGPKPIVTPATALAGPSK